MTTIRIIYKATDTNKVIIQNGLSVNEGYSFKYINCEVLEITKLNINTFIIKHKPIKTIIKQGDTEEETQISEGTILFLCLQGSSELIKKYYCNKDGEKILQQSEFNTKYGKYRTKPFYFTTDGNNLLPPGDNGRSFEDFYRFLNSNSTITIDGKEIIFSNFFREQKGGNGRKTRKSRRKTQRKRASKKCRRSRKRKGLRKKKM